MSILVYKINTTLICILSSFLIILFFHSCKKIDVTNDDPFNIPPDLLTKVNSSVSGFVTDENNAAVLGAPVSAGGVTVSTDKYGYFEIRNIQVVKNAAVVVVNKPGYFKGIKTYIAETGKSAFFRIKLIPKTISGSINAATGGNITLTNGLIIALPANAVLNAVTNAAYTGSVNVSAHWLNPTASDLNQEMPGDLRGISTNGSLKTLTTYGMAAVELTGASGELLQITSGQKATLTMPLPAAILSNAPATIPLWSFDEAKGLWKEEGQAIKTGSNYVGEVSHFSFWNCDVPNNFVQFNCTVKNSNGIPLSNILVKVSVVGSPFNAGYGYTDSSGYAGGAIPANTQFLLEIFPGYGCNTPIYTQNFSSANTNISLGAITVNSSLNTATVTGSVTNCANNPVTNGYIILQINNQYYRHELSNTGTFNFITLLCNNSVNANIIAEDATALQQSTPLNQTLVAGNNAIGNLQACGVLIQEFFTYTLNGGAPITFAAPGDTVFHYGNTTVSFVNATSLPAGVRDVSILFTNTGIGAGSIQNLLSFSSSEYPPNTQTNIPTPINVNITEYGGIGQYISGNFSGAVVTNGPPPNITYNIVCNFRVKRRI